MPERIKQNGIQTLSRIMIKRLLLTGLLIFSLARNCFAEWDSYTKLMLHCDGVDAATTFTDETGKAVTANGNAQIDTAQKKFGTASGLFDGTGDYLSLADSDAWNFGSGDFTIDFWVRFNALPGTNTEMYLFEQRVDADNKWRLNAYDSGGTKYLYFRATLVGNASFEMAKQTTLATATWYHIAFVRTGSTWKFFQDGTQVGTDSTDANAMPDLAASLLIGSGAESGTTELNGWLDEVRISKGVARWTANFTPPTAAYSEVARRIIMIQ